MAVQQFKKTLLFSEDCDCYMDQTEADLKKPTELIDILDGSDHVSVGVYELVGVYDISSKPTATLRTTVQKKK